MRLLSPTALLLSLLLLFCPLLAVADQPGQPGQPLIPFKGTALDGKPYDLQASIGNKPVMLVFWASWCPTCRSEIPRINQLAAQFQNRGMEFIAVNVGYNDSIERAQSFVQKTGMTFPAYFDGSGNIAEQYGLQGVPTIIIADKHGIIRFRNYTAPDISEEKFAQLIAN